MGNVVFSGNVAGLLDISCFGKGMHACALLAFAQESREASVFFSPQYASQLRQLCPGSSCP